MNTPDYDKLDSMLSAVDEIWAPMRTFSDVMPRRFEIVGAAMTGRYGLWEPEPGRPLMNPDIAAVAAVMLSGDIQFWVSATWCDNHDMQYPTDEGCPECRADVMDARADLPQWRLTW